MFSLTSEILEQFKIKDIKNSSNYKTVNIGGKAMYVQGHKSIDKYSSTSINLQLTKGFMFIKGNNLKIQELDVSCIYITGEIFSCEVV